MTVARRLALVFPGFEPMPVEAHCARFIREAKKNAPAFDMEVAATDPVFAAEGVGAGTFTVDASGPGWRTDTQVVVYGLGYLNETYLRRGAVRRTLSGLVALADFLVTGTFFRFVATSWRYGLFFLYPVALFLAALATGILVGHYLPGRSELRFACGLVAFVLALWLVSAKMYFLWMMDDWACARDIARGKRPQIVERIDHVVADIRRRIGAAEVEEVLFAAHSFGAITAIVGLERVLGHGRPDSEYGLLTTGSSLLKVALHPAAQWLRQAVRAVVTSPVSWVDVQALTDPINFYGSDPKTALGIVEGRGPRILHVRFRNQLTDKTYRAIKHNFFRVHRQFVYASEIRTHYSFHAILCGPQRFSDIVARGGLAGRWPVTGKSGAGQP
jgi:hypothetical protein